MIKMDLQFIQEKKNGKNQWALHLKPWVLCTVNMITMDMMMQNNNPYQNEWEALRAKGRDRLAEAKIVRGPVDLNPWIGKFAGVITVDEFIRIKHEESA